MRKVSLILLVMFVGGCMTAAERVERRPANIILVTADSSSDADYIPFLKNLYGDDSNVEAISEKYRGPLDATRIAELRAADLVIVSRRTWSDAYCSTKDISIWNGLTTPLILHNPYLAEPWGKWEWFKNAEKDEAPYDLTHVAVVDAKDPIFDGVVITGKGQVKIYDPAIDGIDVIACSSAGNGTLIARPAESDSTVMIARWAAGTKFYKGSKQTAGGPRIAFFMLKNDEEGSEVSMPKLTADGKKMLENALTSLLAGPN